MGDRKMVAKKSKWRGFSDIQSEERKEENEDVGSIKVFVAFFY